uniref:RNA-directed DNA polymerase, eukaryota, reverse transcriptase zinc-binding domain protein n=1 Tax=Lactuca sativa TaxID=4236 RepID=A0A9R1UMH3_LACSA|nr:hypothetical protein LSAT_V11C800440200 [Lactuca sativa]
MWISKNETEQKRVEELTKEIDSIDTNAESHSPDESKIEYRKNLYRELMDLKAKRILDLKQKSQCKWALEGDENAAFKFFSKNFTEQMSNIPQFLSQKFNKLSPIQTQNIEEPISAAEIKSAVWLCGNDMAHGPDGFTFAFIKKTLGYDGKRHIPSN